MSVIEPVNCTRYIGNQVSGESTSVARESPVTVYVNRQEVATLLCSPDRLSFLVMGYLYSEGIIESKKDLASMRVCDDELEVDVRLVRKDIKLPAPRTLTSGCGGGGTASDRPDVGPVTNDHAIGPDHVTSLMRGLLAAGETHREYGGLHASCLGQEGKVEIVAEDIGRHNTLDKIMGECLARNIETAGKVVASTGRTSSEMIFKAARMRVPIVVSRSAVTGRAVALADKLGITAIGYARGERFTIYSHPERIAVEQIGLAASQRR
ncbi:MAG: formate dehydrogenase accessory sulfurtransferase FdhD [Chloroflexi bacterium]|nr:formate dehydrogenase accessory sulfurtransferase FdhD [Chloroflexota bacterium]